MNLQHVFDTPAKAAEACGGEILQRLGEAAALHGRATVAFSGGSTPKLMFEWMATQNFDWRPVHIFFVDERCVPPDDAESNYRMTREALLGHIQPAGVHRIEGELDPAEAALKYCAVIQKMFGGRPAFDILHLGMGPDAHTASLFPGLPEIEDRSGVAAAVWVDKLAKHRVTLLPAAILDAKQIVMLVTGPDKAPPLREVFSAKYEPLKYPAQLVHRNGKIVDWFLDRAAKSELS